jgi:hypothetical protein
MRMMAAFAAALGNSFETLILPRRDSRRFQVRRACANSAWRSWASIALLVLPAFTMYAQRGSVEDCEALRNDQAPLRFLQEAIASAMFESGVYEVVRMFAPFSGPE